MPDTNMAQTLAAVAAQRNRLWALLIDIERACEVNRPDLATQVATIAKQRDEIVPGHEQKKGETATKADSPKETRITMEIELTERNVLAIEAALARRKRRG